MGYKEDVEVNKYELDVAWESQSELCIHYGDMSVDANNQKEKLDLKVEKLEADLKELLASLTLKVKFNFKDHNFDKAPSDATAQSWAITQPEYKEKQKELYIVKEELIEARDLAFRLRNVAKTFEDRRHSIQNLQHLFFAGYFSDSRVPSQSLTGSKDNSNGNQDKDFNTRMKER